MNEIDESKPLLVISDLQMPFEAQHALRFCVYLKNHFKIPNQNILNVGDEIDQYFGSKFPKNPDSPLSAVGEINATKEKLSHWYSAFPEMKLAVSNHGLRWAKKASAAELPSQMLRAYQEIIKAPKDWVWKKEWLFKTKHPFRMIHGMGYSGINGHRQAAIDAGISTVIGHLHSHAGIDYINTQSYRIWGMNVGSLIDTESFVFEYGNESRFKPWLGASVIFDSGKKPVLFPYE